MRTLRWACDQYRPVLQAAAGAIGIERALILTQERPDGLFGIVGATHLPVAVTQREPWRPAPDGEPPQSLIGHDQNAA